MTTSLTVSVVCCTFSALVASASPADTEHEWPGPQSFPAQPGFPDPLAMLNGERVRTQADWERRRRPELKALFQRYMYGEIPKAVRMEATLRAVHSDFLGGAATLKLITLASPRGGPQIDLMLVVPNERPNPAPVFLALNFCGNHALTADPRVPLSRGWLYDFCAGCVDHKATEAARGAESRSWPLEQIVKRGYALASFCSSDIDSDRTAVSNGIYAWLAAGDPQKIRPAHRGSIAAWAWGFHRCVDYLTTDGDIDPARIAAVGHSRNGKAALLATAFDERIALAIPLQAGSGGSAPSRVKAELAAPQANGHPIAETTSLINRNFPHWFNAAFKEFDGVPERLPFDQHCLVALCAPRPVLFANAQDDRWANPPGQFDILKAAAPVYRLMGVEGLAAAEMPPLGKPVSSRLGYYIRAGEHSMTADDWKVFLAFADRHLAGLR